MREAPDGMYIVKNGITYQVEPRIAKTFPFAKKINLLTGEVIYSSNADSIRSMTDEELAEWIISITEDDTEDWFDWLKQEVTENDS